MKSLLRAAVRSVIASSSGALALALVVGACSSSGDRPPPAGSSGSNVGLPSSSGSSEAGTTTEAGSRADASSDGGNARLCEPLPQVGAEVAELASYNSSPFKAFGGTIAAGTYALTALESDRGTPPDAESLPIEPTGKAARVTLYVTATSLRFVEARGSKGALPADTFAGYSYTASATTLQLTSECPTAGRTSSVGFTAGPSSITLLVDAKHQETYTRQ